MLLLWLWLGTLRAGRAWPLWTLSLRLSLLRTLLLLLAASALPLLAIASLCTTLLLLLCAALSTFCTFAARLARALLELPDFLLHEAARLRILLHAQLAVTAERAALPAFGVRPFAVRAENGFRERHRRIGAHCTLRPVEENRRRTLLALIELATDNSPNACWDDKRAVELLRAQSTPGELRELGMDEGMIAFVFPEGE